MDKNKQLIATDKYGCPRLTVEYKQPLSLSFSYTGQKLWAAVAEVDSLGIDVETSVNFLAPYPYNRAFMADDLHLALSFYPKKEDAAALLWSCKEAAMKSRGTGFHFIDPRDVRILSCLQEGHCMYRVTVATPEEISVVVHKKRHLWLAVTASG
ncbi:MAG: 4'-phosphopantetheinyl transferase superfamily protein [Proteobacteria bacterium]|nr:4'-phosphopantetheinyl transferase superfamily protein [Pseudomonadota bacterium]